MTKPTTKQPTKLDLRAYLQPGRRADERPVVLRLPASGPGRGLGAEVRGEFTHFFAPLPLTPAGDGQREATVHVGPGAYAYKFRTDDGQWHLDPDNPRTRSCDGSQNSLLVVDGAAEPVLHAPAHPFLHLRRDGRLCVRAGLRKGGAGDQLALRWREDAERTVAMQRVAEEDEHWLFEADLPASQREIEYLFVLPSGQRLGHSGGGGQAFRVRRRELERQEPAWWADAIVYTVLLDRFRIGGQPQWRPGGERDRRGGDLWGVIEALPYLHALGVNTLHLTPVAYSYSAHRYDAVSPLQVDPALGGEPALRALFAAAHERGLRVLMDVVLTHVHRDFLPFCDVRARGKQSPYASWFQIYRHPFSQGDYPGYQHYQKGQWEEPLLNLESEEVAAYLAAQCVHWVELGADGLRLDAVAEVPLGLLRLLRAAVRAVRPDAVLLGEVTPDNGYRYTQSALDCATDFPLQQALYDWLWRQKKDARGFAAASARRLFWRGPQSAALGFTATHDQPRLRSLVADERVARLAHLVLLTRPEVPAIYYGDELGLHGDSAGRDFEDAWPDRLPMPWHEAAAEAPTRWLFTQVLRLRSEYAALRYGDLQPIPVSESAQVLAFRRQLGAERIEVYAHGTEADVELALAPEGPTGTTVLFALGAASVAAGRVRLGPYAAIILQRHPEPAAAALTRLILGDNREHCGDAFRQAQLAPLALPASLYLTVTERCNLRCQHCITEAPERTASGRARTMQPWLLDALGEGLAAADYFGFAHGGESLVAPIFQELLRRIQQARAGKPYTVHLLSNGMLLTPNVVEELIDLGVNSLAISIDGVTAATNDFIRQGAKLEVIAHHIRQALALRKSRGADLRVGLSTVLMSSNVDELPALGQLARELGVDWIKVEETYPMNAFSRLHLLNPRGRQAHEATAALRRIVAPAGIVVVDHLAPPGGCPCATAEPAYAEFRRSDDFANRARFLPCRAAWEILCVDPDGTVHPVDYGRPPLGNLIATPLFTLWNSEPAQRLRRDALHKIAAEQRARCPH